MATLLTHVFYIQNILNGGKITDDSAFSNRLVAHALKQARARLIKLKLDKKEYIADSNYQKICIPLQLHAFHDCDCVENPDECKFLKSTYSIPDVIVAKWGTTFQALTLDGKRIPISSITSNSYAEHSLSSNNKLSYFLEQNDVFIQNSKKLIMVLGKAIFADPELAINYMDQVCENNEQCRAYYSQEFPIDSELVEIMYKMTLEDLTMSYKLPRDDKNDSRTPEQIQATDPNETNIR